MKSTFPILCLAIAIFSFSIALNAQKIYPVTSGEFIFSQSQTSFNQDFISQYSEVNVVGNNVRFTVFFHIGQYVHYDITKNIGLYTGLALRNVGMITDEKLPQTVELLGNTVLYEDYKIIRRQYTIGLPLALKLGSFKDHLYFFGGGEIEMAFHYKEKYWTGSYERNDSKTKNSEWFSSGTPTFIPSVFAGVQLPRGVNVKFKYYLNNFLNTDYKSSSNTQQSAAYNPSDLSRYEDSEIFYVSVCWQFKTAEMLGAEEKHKTLTMKQ